MYSLSVEKTMWLLTHCPLTISLFTPPRDELGVEAE